MLFDRADLHEESDGKVYLIRGNMDLSYHGQVNMESMESMALHGKGVLVERGGEVYDGEFVRSFKEGQGVLTKPNGDVYQGSFEGNYNMIKIIQ